jgi:hypothetical protein
MAGEPGRLRHAMIPVINEISLFINRLNLSDPGLRPETESLMSAVRGLMADMEAPENQFMSMHDGVFDADRALRNRCDELAAQDRPQGLRARRRQRREVQRGHQVAGPTDDDPPDGKPQAYSEVNRDR